MLKTIQLDLKKQKIQITIHRGKTNTQHKAESKHKPNRSKKINNKTKGPNKTNNTPN